MARRPGRPKKKESERKSGQISVRLSRALKAQLDRARADHGVLLSEEISGRLAMSFSPPQERARKDFGDQTTYDFLWAIAKALTEIRNRTGQLWYRDPFAFQKAEQAFTYALANMRPEGRVEVPDDHPLLEQLRTEGFKDLEFHKAQLLEHRLGERLMQDVFAELSLSLGDDAPESIKYLVGRATQLEPKLSSMRKVRERHERKEIRKQKVRTS